MGTSRSGRVTLSGDSREIGCKSRIRLRSQFTSNAISNRITRATRDYKLGNIQLVLFLHFVFSLFVVAEQLFQLRYLSWRQCANEVILAAPRFCFFFFFFFFFFRCRKLGCRSWAIPLYRIPIAI